MIDKVHPALGTISVPKAFVQSLALHIVVIVAFTINAFLIPDEPISLKNAIRVDMVALPEKRNLEEIDLEEPVTTEPKEAPTPTAEVQTVPLPNKAEPAKVNISEVKKAEETREKAKSQAIARLKAFKILEEDSKKKSQTNPATQRKELWAGNIITSGTSLAGVEKIQHQEYISQLDRHIKNHWALPQWLASGNFRATINVRLDEHGNVIKKEIVKSSGNRHYDEKVLEAVLASSPFPPPPKKFVHLLANTGVDFGFPE